MDAAVDWKGLVSAVEAGKRLAIFIATSGHSEVDRIVNNLVPAFAASSATLHGTGQCRKYLETLLGDFS